MRPRKTYHHGDLKAHLADAALAFLEHHHPEALSIRDLCRELGVSPMAPYRHFEDKAALLIHLAKSGCGELLRQLKAAEENEADPRRLLANCAEVYARFAREKSSQFRLIFGAELSRAGDRAAPVIELAMQCIEVLVRAISAGQRTKSIRDDVPAARIAEVVWMAVHGYAEINLNGHGEATPEALNLLIDTVLRGISAPRRSRAFARRNDGLPRFGLR
ncbi:MAG TPA: hypothetical protein DEH78_04805 [Solibacterales bacterium]|nr:hypothetical protein [Bryobacterales bacterium]